MNKFEQVSSDDHQMSAVTNVTQHKAGKPCSTKGVDIKIVHRGLASNVLQLFSSVNYCLNVQIELH